jgi:hypothetical protein
MRKLIVLLVAVFLAVFAVNANAANITVANTDFKLAGGITATYNYVSDTRSDAVRGAVDDHDYFDVDTAIVHLLKNPTLDSPVGGHLAYGSFDVKLVTGGIVVPRLGTTTATVGRTGGLENFRLWLGYFSYMPIENVTVDAGMLWHKFGEAPITILNSHVTRPVAFIAQPVCFGGARIGYDAGIAKVYVGTNNGSDLGAGHGNHDNVADVKHPGLTMDSDRAYEVGASANIESLTIAANYFDHDEGYNTINGSVGVAAGMLKAKVEVNYVSVDTYNRTLAGTKAKDDDAICWALYACAKLTDDFKIPVRVELVDDMGSEIYMNPTAAAARQFAGFDGWNVTVTPTFNPTPNSFIRLEGVYAEDNNRGRDERQFRDSEGQANKRDDRHAVIAEFGFLF